MPSRLSMPRLDSLVSGIPAASAVNPNLLLWSEEMGQAAWTKTSCTVTDDVSGTLDEIASTGAGAVLGQVSATASLSGADVTSTKVISVVETRYSMTGTFDGLSYTLSAKIKDTGLAADPKVVFRLSRSGGFLKASFEDPAADADYLIGEIQLEQAAAYTSYVKREGT